jgi:outer membrane protein assembly factor BamD
MRQKLIAQSPRSAAPFRAALSLLAVIGCAALTGCSSVSMPRMPPLPWSNPSIKENASAEALYNEGVQMLSSKKYVPAIERFQKLRSDYPFAPELVAAEIKLGEAYYLNKQYTEAVETLKEFEAMHPNNENIPYALYLSGMAHFDQFSSIDRDQKTTEVAKGFFERLVNNYPQSPYTAKAQDKLAKCLEYLAEHEFDIASYYMREKKYPAARDRLEGILRRYRNTSVAPKALYQLGESYRQEKNNLKAALAFEALTEHYPNDPLAKNARAQLTQLAQEKQDPLAALLKPEPRPTAALAQKKTDADEKAKDAPRVAKTEVVDEQPGDEKGFLERVVDKMNPFSSSSPAPAKPADKKAAPVKTASASANSAQLIGTIDESLNRKSVDGASAKSAGDPTPPSPDLPQISEASLPPAPSEAATLSAIDGKLANKSQVAAAPPPPPQAAAILKTPIDENAVAKSQGAKALPDTSTLLSSIDGKLKGKGLDAGNEEARIELPAGQKPVVTPRPKSAPEKVLEPRLTTEQGPLYLPPDETANREKSPETASAPAPSAPSPTLPALAIKGPPQPDKDKPAETKLAAKSKSPEEEEDPADKGLFDQLKEDLGRVKQLLNPFSW